MQEFKCIHTSLQTKYHQIVIYQHRNGTTLFTSYSIAYGIFKETPAKNQNQIASIIFERITNSTQVKCPTTIYYMCTYVFIRLHFFPWDWK